ncbi:hypothetical protein ABK249_14550 [Neorhizobium sp. Rsf11]|uniref:Uncharacterized protein n=1 Tax=Neorhizobium phenanthreniclasticum TaxID=3157917 RepID=A0ABV0M3A5_9HYPH
MATTAATVYRDYETDGVPASGNHKVKKPDIRTLLTGYEGIINAFTAGGGFIYTSRAALFADLAHDANSSAWVIGDATTAYNGIYMKSGASGTGSWTRVADLPFSFIIASDVGAGTANAIQATTSIPVSASALVWMNVFEANTTSAVTVSFNGGAPLAIKTNSGNDPSVGGLAAGMIIMGVVSGSTFRLVSDQTSSAIVAAAEAAAAAANAGNLANIATLSALPDESVETMVSLSIRPSIACHTTSLDGGGGSFITFAAADWTRPIDNHGLAIENATGNYVFVREEFLQDGRVSPRWFGAKGDGTAEDAALTNWINAYHAVNSMPMSVNPMVANSAWLFVPQGRFVFGTTYTWNPKGGMATMVGVGHQSCIVGMTIALYNDNSTSAGAAQFARISNVDFDGAGTHANGIVYGDPDNWAAVFDGTYSGTRECLIENVFAYNYTNAGLMFIRDNHGRIRNCNFNANKYGMLVLTAIDTEFEGVHCHDNNRDGVCVQPWAGNASVGPFSTGGPGGLNLRGVNARGNKRYNFFVTGGDLNTIISDTDTEDGVEDLDFFGESTIRVGKIWECYFDSLSAANYPQGSMDRLTKTITSIVRDTTDTNNIKVTLSTPHYFQRGLLFEGSNLIDMDGTGVAGYDTPVPRSGSSFRVQEVYSATTFSMNIQYVSDFSGTATWKQPRPQLVIKGQEKGYSPQNINDIWLAGKNHNHVFLERCNRIYFPHTRLKNQITLGAAVTGLEIDFYAGVSPGVATDDCTVHIFGESFDNGWVRRGLREFDVTWRNWSPGTNKTGSNYGYSIERPVTGGGARTDRAAAGAARYFHAVHWRPDSIVFGHHDAQNDTYRGLKSKNDGDLEILNETGVAATWESSTGNFTFNSRVNLLDSRDNTVSNLPNVYISPTNGNLARYTGDPIFEEGGDDTVGRWIKFASGRMECFSQTFSGISVGTADGSGFQSAAQTWTFPQAFVATPLVIGVSVGSVAQAWPNAYGISTTQAEGRLFSFQSRTGRSMAMAAFGRYK